MNECKWHGATAMAAPDSASRHAMLAVSRGMVPWPRQRSVPGLTVRTSL